MPKYQQYHGERITIFAHDDIRFYLLNGDGDVDEYRAKSVEEAKTRIDKHHAENNITF